NRDGLALEFLDRFDRRFCQTHDAVWAFLEDRSDYFDRNVLLLGDDDWANRPIAELRLAARNIGHRIDVGATGDEGRLDAELLKRAVLHGGEEAAVLDALDPGQLKR